MTSRQHEPSPASTPRFTLRTKASQSLIFTTSRPSSSATMTASSVVSKYSVSVFVVAGDVAVSFEADRGSWAVALAIDEKEKKSKALKPASGLLGQSFSSPPQLRSQASGRSECVESVQVRQCEARREPLAELGDRDLDGIRRPAG